VKILFITNYYPPSNKGWGYMQLCEEVADGLSLRGHEVAVLTSSRRDGPEMTRSYPVYRLLPLDPNWDSGSSIAWQFFVGRRHRERTAAAHFCEVVADFKPTVIFVWHTIGIPRIVLKCAEEVRGVPSTYYLADLQPELRDEYMAYWNASPVHWSARLFKHALARLALRILDLEGKPVPLRYDNAICVSKYVQERLASRALIPQASCIIHNGINIDRFRNCGTPAHSRSFSLLYAGRLDPNKGVDVIIEALLCLREHERQHIERVTIVGDGPDSYKQHLRHLTGELLPWDVVRFYPPLPRDRMPNLLSRHDVLLLPSNLEALSRMMQEAMAMGLLVIGTNTGGSNELLVHEETGLVCQAGNPVSLARQIERALREPEFSAQLAHSGQLRVQTEFDIQHTITQIEAYLKSVLGSHIATDYANDQAA
jgi:glycosyltransferase involved in cell wall biosynthesis